MALQALLTTQGGNTAPWAYRDKNHPRAVAETFGELIARQGASVYFPELKEYLLEYPKAKSDNVRTGFYWEKVNLA
jgi:hypothetical protein